MALYQRWQTVLSQSVFVLVVTVFGSALLGLSGLWVVEQELVARAGESFALGAMEVAGKLDSMLQERDGDIEILAGAPQLRSGGSAQMAEHLLAVQRAYPVYARLAVADRTGRVVASTDQSWVGQDVRDASWFQAARHGPRAYTEIVKKGGQSKGQGQLQGVVFSAPIYGDHGTLHGVIMTEVDADLWSRLVEDTVKQFATQTRNFGTVRYRVLGVDGNVLLTLEGYDKPAINLRELNLPSAIKVATGRSGYVEEEHLIRKVPVVTGYARMHGVRSLSALQWGVLVRADRAEVLANIRGILMKLGLVGIGIFLPTFGLLIWFSHCQQREQEKAEAAMRSLAESETRTRAVLHNAMDAVVVMDGQGMISGWNRQAEVIFGWETAEVLGRSLVETLVPPQYRDAHRQGVARYLSTGKAAVLNARIEISALRKDGTEFPIELTITPLKLERDLLFSAFIRDISERTNMMDRLRTSETFFRLMSDHLPIGVYEIDDRGVCLYGNRMWRTLFNLSEAADNGDLGLWLQWFHPDDRENVEREWRHACTTSERVAVECRLVGDGEEARWVNVLLWPMVSEEGVRYLGTLEDITERKRTVAHTMTLLRHGRFELRTLDEAKHLAELLAYAFPDPSRTQLGLTELLVNGVEHGNLNLSYAEKSALLKAGTLDREIARRLALPGYAQKRVRVSLDRSEAALQMCITDGGDGFDWSQYLDLDGVRSADGHGRGIAMAKAVSFDQLEFQGCGNQVVVSVSLNGVHTDAWPEEERRAA